MIFTNRAFPYRVKSLSMGDMVFAVHVADTHENRVPWRTFQYGGHITVDAFEKNREGHIEVR